MERWLGKVAIVTGASAGMGECITENLVKFGMQVVGVARRVEKIQAKADELGNARGKLYARKCDMTVEEDIKSTFVWVTHTLGPVHILVNAAGGNPGTDILSGDVEKWRLCFETNVIGLSTACREAVRIMLDNGVDGHIVNFNSLLGHMNVCMPSFSLYSASKHAITSMTELLRQELAGCGKKNNIKVTSISPGAVSTEFLSDTTRDSLHKIIKNVVFLSREDVTDAVMYVLGTPPRVHIQELVIVANE